MPLTKHTRFKLNATAAAVMSALIPLSAQGEAGRINFASGIVQATNSEGARRALGKGSVVMGGDTITTSGGSLAHIRFKDGAYVSLKPNSNFRIDEYRYENDDAGESWGFFSLLKGGLRTITGLIGKRNNNDYRMSTSVATIGIRGTHYDLDVGEGSTGSKTEVRNFIDSASLVLKINPEFELLTGETAALQPIFLADGASVVELTITDRQGEARVYQIDSSGRIKSSGDTEFLSPEESAVLLGERILDPDIGYGVSDPSDDGGADLGSRIQEEIDRISGPSGPYGG
ncbi:MAG: FecR domain-containing protein [Gammaproteobacteria bacterium]|nr:FecR domain-containing protein [Gammaproteobacteria bacterium]